MPRRRPAPTPGRSRRARAPPREGPDLFALAASLLDLQRRQCCLYLRTPSGVISYGGEQSSDLRGRGRAGAAGWAAERVEEATGSAGAAVDADDGATVAEAAASSTDVLTAGAPSPGGGASLSVDTDGADEGISRAT